MENIKASREISDIQVSIPEGSKVKGYDLVKEGSITELKSLVKEVEESEKYFKWYTTESWSREMTEEEERKGDDLYDLKNQCQSRIFEIIKSL